MDYKKNRVTLILKILCGLALILSVFVFLNIPSGHVGGYPPNEEHEEWFSYFTSVSINVDTHKIDKELEKRGIAPFVLAKSIVDECSASFKKLPSLENMAVYTGTDQEVFKKHPMNLGLNITLGTVYQFGSSGDHPATSFSYKVRRTREAALFIEKNFKVPPLASLASIPRGKIKMVTDSDSAFYESDDLPIYGGFLELPKQGGELPLFKESLSWHCSLLTVDAKPFADETNKYEEVLLRQH